MHYPGTYIAGVYNRLITLIGGRLVEDEHLVNAPNWLPFDVRVGDGKWWSAGGLTLLGDRPELNLRRGVLSRWVRLATSDGRRLRITQRRLVSMAKPRVGALETILTAEGWDGAVAVRSGIDGAVVNGNVREYGLLANRHLTVLEAQETDADTLVLEADTTTSHIRIAVAVRTTVDASASSAEPLPARQIRDWRRTHRACVEHAAQRRRSSGRGQGGRLRHHA